MFKEDEREVLRRLEERRRLRALEAMAKGQELLSKGMEPGKVAEKFRDAVTAPMGLLRVYDEEGLVTQSDNMIVVGYRKSLVNLLTGNRDFRVYKVVLSNGGWGVSAEGTQERIDPVFYDRTLKGEAGVRTTIKMLDMVEKDTFIFSRSDLSVGVGAEDFDTVRFRWSLGREEGNGLTGGVSYTEAGMFCGDGLVKPEEDLGTGGENGLLFARVVFTPVVKGSSRTLSFEWIVSFT